MLISETTKMTSSAKRKNPCQENPAKDYLNYSTLIPTGWNYNIPPKYMIYECTLAVRNLKSLFTIRVILPLQNHSHYRRSHHRNQHHILLHTQAHTPSFFPLIPTCIIVRIASYIFDTIIIPILLSLLISSIIVWIDTKIKSSPNDLIFN